MSNETNFNGNGKYFMATPLLRAWMCAMRTNETTGQMNWRARCQRMRGKSVNRGKNAIWWWRIMHAHVCVWAKTMPIAAHSAQTYQKWINQFDLLNATTNFQFRMQFLSLSVSFVAFTVLITNGATYISSSSPGSIVPKRHFNADFSPDPKQTQSIPSTAKSNSLRLLIIGSCRSPIDKLNPIAATSRNDWCTFHVTIDLQAANVTDWLDTLGSELREMSSLKLLGAFTHWSN